MVQLKLFTENNLKAVLQKRSKETKLGQSIKTLSSFNTIYDSMLKTDVQYVLLGIKEDIGVIANNGISGAYKAWDTAINYLLNCQDTVFVSGEKLLVLGHLEFPE